MPPVGASKGMGRLKFMVCCRDNCRFVVGFVAGGRNAGQRENVGISMFFLYSLPSGNESNKKFKENSDNKNITPDIGLQVF